MEGGCTATGAVDVLGVIPEGLSPSFSAGFVPKPKDDAAGESFFSSGFEPGRPKADAAGAPSLLSAG